MDSPAGEAQERHQWPLSDQDLEIFLLRIGHTRRGVRKIDSPEMKAARGFGAQLYDAVFSGQIGTSFERSLDEAERQGQGLRIRLRTDDTAELSDVPWEFLYSTSLHRFLTVSTTTPLVRYIEQSRLIAPLAVEEAVRILTMVSSPTDVADLDVEDEWARINESLSDLASSGLIDLRRLPEATMGALQRELRQREYHVFHFIGHGGFDADSDDGVLMFEDDQGRGHKVSGEHLGTILHDHESLRLVVLNSCEGARSAPQDPFGGTAQGLVRQGIPAVIGMQFEITDDAAIIFSHDFYAAIADGYPVDAALAEARKAIFTSGNDVEWGTPVLHMRAPDGRIFDRAQVVVPPQNEGVDELSDRLAEVERTLGESDFERAVVELESIVHDYPRSAAAAGKLDAAQRSLRASRLYASARVLSQAEQWQAVVDRFLEIRALDQDFADPGGLLSVAEEALAVQKRNARLDSLYQEAEAAAAQRDWNQAVRLLGLVLAEDTGYRGASELLEEATAWRDATTLRRAAQEAFGAEDWHAVISRFDELRLLGPGYSDDPDELESAARARLGADEQLHQLEAEYDAAIALVDEEQWTQAIQILDKIAAEQADYPGLKKLRATIQEQARQQEVGQVQQRAAALYAAASALVIQEDWSGVIDTLDQLDALAPDYPGSRSLRGQARAQTQTSSSPLEDEALATVDASAPVEEQAQSAGDGSATEVPPSPPLWRRALGVLPLWSWAGLVALAFAAVIAVAVVAGNLGGDDTSEPAADEPPATEESPATDEEGALPPVAFGEELTFGMILVGPDNDDGWSQAHWEGGEYVEEQLGATMLLMDEVNLADRPGTSVEQVVDDMIAQGAQLIFATDVEMKDGIVAAAAAHPDVPMIWASGDSAWEDGEAYRADLANLGNIMGQMEYGKHIAGCAAALTTQTGSIAYLGPLMNDQTRRFVNSAYLGAQYCWENILGNDPVDLQFEVNWIGFWFNIPGFTLDPTEVTNAFFDGGADVVISGIDTSEATVRAGQRAAAGETVWAIPYNFERGCDEAPDICLGVPYFNWGPVYLETANSVIDGTFAARWRWLPPDWSDMNNRVSSAIGWVNGDGLSPANAETLAAFISGLGDGSIDLFVGPLNFQDGTPYLTDGELSTAQQVWYTKQLLEGIK